MQNEIQTITSAENLIVDGFDHTNKLTSNFQFDELSGNFVEKKNVTINKEFKNY